MDIAYGADRAFLQETFTLEEMLILAMEEEYMARTEYEMVMEQLGKIRPFSEIIESEIGHVNMMKDLLMKYNLPIPEDESRKYFKVPETMQQALEEGIKSEIENIKMYDLFLSKELPEEVRKVFINLKRASKVHLSTFEMAQFSRKESKGIVIRGF